MGEGEYSHIKSKLDVVFVFIVVAMIGVGGMVGLGVMAIQHSNEMDAIRESNRITQDAKDEIIKAVGKLHMDMLYDETYRAESDG